MNKTYAIKMVLKHFKETDKFNQLRPGESRLVIEGFTQGFLAMLNLAEKLKLSQLDFDEVIHAMDEHFVEFETSATKTSEVE